MKILQVCYKMPYPMHDGGEYSLYHCAMSLLTQPGIDLKTIAINTPKCWINPSDMPDEFIRPTKFEYGTVDTRVKPFRAFLNLCSSESYFVVRFYSSTFAEKISELLQSDTYDIVLLEHLYLCTYLPFIRKHSNAKVVLRAQNVEYKLWEGIITNHRQILSGWFLKISAGRLRSFEKEMLGKVDGVIALTEQDNQAFGTMQPATPVTTIPLGFDFNRLKSYDFEEQFRHDPVVYHLGSMDWLPNIRGVQWFIEEVMPLIIAERPGIRIRLAGKKMPDWFYRYQGPNLIIDGHVADSLDYQSDKPILVVPLLSGSGIRVKIIEGLASGKTIISTSPGATGINLGSENPVLIADDAETFAKKVIKCVDSVPFCRETSGKARALAQKLFQLDTIGKAKIDFFKNLLLKSNLQEL